MTVKPFAMGHWDQSVSHSAGIKILAHLGTAFSFFCNADIWGSLHTVACCQGVCMAEWWKLRSGECVNWYVCVNVLVMAGIE